MDVLNILLVIYIIFYTYSIAHFCKILVPLVCDIQMCWPLLQPSVESQTVLWSPVQSSINDSKGKIHKKTRKNLTKVSFALTPTYVQFKLRQQRGRARPGDLRDVIWASPAACNLGGLWPLSKHYQCYCTWSAQSQRQILVTFETLIAILTIENLNS